MTSLNQKTFSASSNTEKGVGQKVVALPMKTGYKLVQQDQILYCKAAGNYTEIFFTNGSSLLISRKLKETANSLANDWFLRIHQSYLVNMRFATQYFRKSGGQLLMSDGQQFPISKNHKAQVLSFFKFV